MIMAWLSVFQVVRWHMRLPLHSQSGLPCQARVTWPRRRRACASS